MAHTEHSTKAKVSTPCAAQSIAFGGRCLNCGYDPSEDEADNTYRSPQGFTGKRMGQSGDGAYSGLARGSGPQGTGQ